MKQCATNPGVLESACGALGNIATNPVNRVIAGAAGAVQVNVSPPHTPPLKRKLPSHYSAPYPSCISPPSPNGTPPTFSCCTLPYIWNSATLYGVPPPSIVVRPNLNPLRTRTLHITCISISSYPATLTLTLTLTLPSANPNPSPPPNTNPPVTLTLT